MPMFPMNTMIRTMKIFKQPRLFLTTPLLAIFAVLALPTNNLSAQTGCTVTLSSGSGTMVGGTAVTSGTALQKDDTLRTDATGSASLDVAGSGTVKVGPNATLVVETSYCPSATGGKVRLKLVEGNLWASGNSTGTKVEIGTPNFVATLANSTIAVNASALDTIFTLVQGTQEISTREWTDTVDVQMYTFPFQGEVSTIFALSGRVIVVPWGGRGAIVREGQQATMGYDEAHISSKPQEINQTELVYAVDGTFQPTGL